jgi:hypothetical protein
MKKNKRDFFKFSLGSVLFFYFPLSLLCIKKKKFTINYVNNFSRVWILDSDDN